LALSERCHGRLFWSTLYTIGAHKFRGVRQIYIQQTLIFPKMVYATFSSKCLQGYGFFEFVSLSIRKDSSLRFLYFLVEELRHILEAIHWQMLHTQQWEDVK